MNAAGAGMAAQAVMDHLNANADYIAAKKAADQYEEGAYPYHPEDGVDSEILAEIEQHIDWAKLEEPETQRLLAMYEAAAAALAQAKQDQKAAIDEVASKKAVAE